MWQQFFKDYFTFTRKERTGILLLLAVIATLWLIPEFIDPTQNELSAIEIEEFKAAAAKLHPAKEDSNLGIDEWDGKKSYLDSGKAAAYIKAELFEFDPNTLSLAGWRKLGLKEKTIRTIQNFLAKGGHFYQPEDIGKIYSLSENEYKTLVPYIRIHEKRKNVTQRFNYVDSGKKNSSKAYSSSFKISHSQIDINEADSAELEGLPGIGNRLASRIINFRNRLGGFHNVAQVAETYGLQDSVFQKIRHRLIISPGFIPSTININLADLKTLQSHPYIRFNIANAIIQYRAQHGLFAEINDLQKIDLITPDLLARIRPYITI